MNGNKDIKKAIGLFALFGIIIATALYLIFLGMSSLNCKIKMEKNLKKTLHMETTSKSVEASVNEIIGLFKKANIRVRDVLIKYDEDTGNVNAVSFMIGGQQGEWIPYMLPARYEGILKLAQRGETRYIKSGDEDQARRVAWRQIYCWVQAQLALVETEMVSVHEVFFPYVMISEDQTLFNKYISSGISMRKLLESNENESEHE